MRERAEYRIPYPVSDRPVLVLEGGEQFPVIDCSARGLRYSAPDRPAPSIGTEMRGTLRFGRRAEVEVEGTVVWTQEGFVALHFPDMEIPFSVLMDEQRYLRSHYPMWP